jgi:hypothetical protein
MFPFYTTTFGLATYNIEITGHQDLGKLLMVGYLEIKQYLSQQKHNDYLENMSTQCVETMTIYIHKEIYPV